MKTGRKASGKSKAVRQTRRNKKILAKGKKRLKEDEQKKNPPKLKLAPIR